QWGGDEGLGTILALERFAQCRQRRRRVPAARQGIRERVDGRLEPGVVACERVQPAGRSIDTARGEITGGEQQDGSTPHELLVAPPAALGLGECGVPLAGLPQADGPAELDRAQLALQVPPRPLDGVAVERGRSLALRLAQLISGLRPLLARE